MDAEMSTGRKGLVARVLQLVRRARGSQTYEEVGQIEEEMRLSVERRQKETPSAIYAHRTVNVSQCYRVAREID